MRYLKLNGLGDVANRKICFTDHEPDPIDSYDLIIGARVDEEYPDGWDEVTLRLSDDHPGLELTSYIGNTDSMLIVDRAAADCILAHEVGEVEVIPLKLLDHKGRMHSDAYVFLNPVGPYDCLDMERCDCKYHDDGELMKITRHVVSEFKAIGAPHLIRPVEAPHVYLFSEELVRALEEGGHTNFLFVELEHS